MENICRRLKTLRQDYMLSQVDFAKRLGVTNAHISKIESGKTVPSEALVRLISKEFRLNELWLKSGEGPMYIFDMEEDTENLLTKSTQQFNQLLKTDNPVIRAKAAQLNMLFSEIVSGDYFKENDRIKYLKMCEKLLYDINSLIASLKDFVSENQLSFEQSDMAYILKDKHISIVSDLEEIEDLYMQNRV